MDARRPQRTRRLPALEHLEQKALLSPFMVMNTADSGAGSLRKAILDSNAAPPPAGGTNLIEFNIPTSDPAYNATSQSWTIAPLSSLPTVTAPALINGYTQPGASPNTNPPGMGKNTILKIELYGQGGPVLLNGLTISAGNSTVSGLVIDGCNIGIDLTGSGGDTIAGNFIGTDVTGKLRAGSNTGLELDSVGNITVGGTAPGQATSSPATSLASSPSKPPRQPPTTCWKATSSAPMSRAPRRRTKPTVWSWRTIPATRSAGRPRRPATSSRAIRFTGSLSAWDRR